MINDIINSTAHLIRTNLQEICLSITAICMVLFGPHINSFVKTATNKFNWFFRYFIFILLVTAGYGALTQIIFKGLRVWMAGLANQLLVIATAVIFLTLALIAKQQKEI
ncbi:MAG: DUF3392 family protein [Fibrobacter sp.]|nr:DUF3392 family protein [Fibrobacter sp.]